MATQVCLMMNTVEKERVSRWWGYIRKLHGPFAQVAPPWPDEPPGFEYIFGDYFSSYLYPQLPPLPFWRGPLLE